MATLISKPHWGRLVARGTFAGILGAILINVYEALAMHQALPAFWQWVASAAFGARVAGASPTYVWIGLLILVVVGIAWAIGYAYAVATSPRIASIPWLAGLIFGAVVWLAMDIVLMFDQMTPPTNATAIVTELVGACVFYGLPVALILRAQAGDA